MAIEKLGIEVIDADAERSNGIFTAKVVWALNVTIGNVIEMLPDRVAYLFLADLPLEGTPYPGVPLATCRKVACKRKKGGLYHFTANYSDEDSDSEPGTNENPLFDRPIIKPTATLKPVAITRDRDGYGIMNRANDPVIESMEDNGIGFQVTANIAYVPNFLGALRNTCNGNTITVAGLPIAPEVARFILPSNWISSLKNRNNVNYYEFTYDLLLDEKDTHYGYPMNAGFRELADDGSGGTIRKTITEEDGSEPNDPVPLTWSGKKLNNPTPSTTTFLQVKKYPTADYTVLPGVA